MSGTREPFFIREDKNDKPMSYIKNFGNFVGVYYQFLNFKVNGEKCGKTLEESKIFFS